jgi:hypothetical protein
MQKKAHVSAKRALAWAFCMKPTGGGWICTGFMMNNMAQDRTSSFRTVCLCGLTASTADTMVLEAPIGQMEPRFSRSPAAPKPVLFLDLRMKRRYIQVFQDRQAEPLRSRGEVMRRRVSS